MKKLIVILCLIALTAHAAHYTNVTVVTEVSVSRDTVRIIGPYFSAAGRSLGGGASYSNTVDGTAWQLETIRFYQFKGGTNNFRGRAFMDVLRAKTAGLTNSAGQRLMYVSINEDVRGWVTNINKRVKLVPTLID